MSLSFVDIYISFFFGNSYRIIQLYLLCSERSIYKANYINEYSERIYTE